MFPCSLVICNDIAAYFCGRYFGKRKLTPLSPNKTLEGFIGALVVTVIYGLLNAIALSKIDFLVRHTGPSDNSAIYKNIGYHGVVLALFASTFAPFAGFFASAIKRAGGLKDFDHIIPGHGGLTDRLDCQLFMAFFTYFYYQSITSN
ncbi:phosphatidate cytidylyltransferase [Mycotypha africana]|uniref:phosphatidate cytidylyltransferase n=1 Tax=Mycotypha africana TaxID=64632 RepID=UPI0022FFC6E3|nr:phosphatidate cytidylyltransferase [Mycotypha africana]KAI8987288.1 phosphatidate cytidylyltransferase [Mycotypha africana]